MTKISTHASRAGGDPLPGCLVKIVRDFNPRLPCGRRPGSFFDGLASLSISTHASRAGGDSKKQQKNPLLFSHSKSFLFHSVNHQAIPSIL